MLVTKIDSMLHHTGEGISFDSLDAVEQALRRLGEMRGETATDVDRLIKQMRHDIKHRTTVSAIVKSTMSHYQHGEEYRTPDGLTLEKSGRIYGCSYFSHNSCGLTQEAPFSDLEVKVEKIHPSDGKPEIYMLVLFNNVDPVGSTRSELLLPRNHTESTLVHSLTGQERPLQKIAAIVEFETVNGLVEFDFAWIINMLGALKGMGMAEVDPKKIAWRFYQHLLGRRFGSCLGVTFPHSSGATVALNSCHGVKTHQLGPRAGVHRALKRTDAVLSGPLQPFRERPCFRLEFLSNGRAVSQQLTDLFQVFKATCLTGSN